MDPVVPSGEASPLIDTDMLTVVCDYDGVFQNLIDEDMVIMNRIGDEIHAEIVLSLDDDTVSHRRLMTAQAVAGRLGYRAYSRFFGDLYEDSNVVTLQFTDDPAKGVIWALTEEMAVGDWLN
jgi:hypothetical protein